jgi:nucleoside-diphosphate kinase
MDTLQRTLVIIKADTIRRKLVGRVIQHFEEAGFDVIAMKMVKPALSLAKKHYTVSKQWKIGVGTKAISRFNDVSDAVENLGTVDALKIGNAIWKWSVDQLSQGPVIVIVLEGDQAIERIKKLAGDTEPANTIPGTIRGKFANDSIIHSQLEKRALFNVIHRSSNVKEAKREIAVWFSSKEIY